MVMVGFSVLAVALAHVSGLSRVPASQLRVRGGARPLMSDAPLPPPPPPPAVPYAEGTSAEGLKTITLTHPANGDSAVIYTYGACVTSYKHDGIETLKIRPDAKLDGSKPISGGIPFCFPQFGPGEIQQHGFARNLEWEVLPQPGGADPAVALRLVDSDATRAMWPHAFEATYTVTLTPDSLQTSFKVLNSGDAPFSFTGALHSYFDVSAIANLKIKGNFKGAQYLDKTASPPAERTAPADEITISKETDSVYKGVSGCVVLQDSGKGTALSVSCKQGWRDTVVWNPYGDEGMGYNSFVCAEAAVAAFPFTLQPGAEWTGLMDLECNKL